ncbi:prenyltransferase/squalene oxidase repeat-containing protein [Marinifilum caeruleilacunae]|uniref:Squalene--hopene cyclase n=1 Tax=Marinifilum caeruleilacunae TaxID=2499076 RepID=A0ABX1WXZ4_9BACT|nr:prenyltransferase/squalene oxidase repeat-containing protein [Marinifilum caeruleilacunae]NOU60967.1 squalene--hopene cyclase [Marinifilum caeruleilacunae]
MDQIYSRIQSLKQKLDNQIISVRNENGYWDGQLSSSALSTAVAVFALWKYDKKKYDYQINKGLYWLAENVNLDGAWGDTIRSKSNLSTTLLTWACFSIAKDRAEFAETIQNAEDWLKDRLKKLDPESISSAVLNHYQSDQTFSVPILSMCALAGRLGDKGWKLVPQLPFQMAVFPDQLFKFLKLSVVSYAIPALIAIGLVKSRNSRQNKLVRKLNKWVKPKVLKILAEKQPDNGGFLEATPLTGFVLMSLIGAGERKSEVCKKAADFLEQSIREDGSWPIDTHLATWVSSLAVNALDNDRISELSDREMLVSHYLNQQLKNIHPFTKAKPGGWAWTHLQGGVPDADDTSGALIALHKLSKFENVPLDSIAQGIQWLMDLQNYDGGLPTFCRGWGKLPFDCSCPDITAHTLKAFALWKDQMDSLLQNKMEKSIRSAWKYLRKSQQEDGSWLPLWFGNEDDMQHQNPVYGTSIVLYSLSDLHAVGLHDFDEVKNKALAFLQTSQNEDGGWGGSANIISSIEESSLAIRALASHQIETHIESGIKWLELHLPKDLNDINATPIGLYFASLWYFEDMYPLVFASSAMNEVEKLIKNYELSITNEA